MPDDRKQTPGPCAYAPCNYPLVVGGLGRYCSPRCRELHDAQKVERARIVAWLRNNARPVNSPWSKAADFIERGEHVIGT